MKTLLLATTAVLGVTLSAPLFAFPAHAQTSDNVIRIGVLNDRSGGVADLAGEGSVVAARMAVEDFGGIRWRREDRGCLRRPPEQGRHCRQHHTPVD